ncbi:MAG: hypothetical protein KatS3mg010_1877 [Acidimicrobiia bacterium]|nr:MAG: hypothetical protein KatS3mg010_1877 [Acidimicrobiia bacterium]
MTVLCDAPARDVVADSPARRHPLTVAGWIAAVASGLALSAYTRSEMWLDEALSVDIARLPLGDLREALERDGAPPLYYALLHAWTGLLGDGNVAARSLSACFAAAALVAMWFVARRVGGTALAWTAVVVMATNPYVVRYATEARMYTLVILLVTAGMLVVDRALEQPTFQRLVPVSLVVAALIHTHYWGFSVIAVTGAALALIAWRDAARRRAAVATLVATAIGGLTFLAWLPSFLYQRAHTGTPWGEPVLPGLPIGRTLLAFSGGEEQEGWLLLLVAIPLVVLGAFGLGVDRRRVELDLRGRGEVRWHALIGGASLVVGVTLGYLAGQAFEARYSAIVFPFFVLLAARGVTTLRDERVRVGVLAVVVLLGLVGGVRNASEQRTQAGDVGAILTAEARAGDLVVYCPDQLGPSVHRVTDTAAAQVTYPAFASPAFVDWVDYEDRLAAADPAAFVDEVLTRVGRGTVWYVTGPGYATHAGVCEAMADDLASARERIPRVLPDEDVFEKPGLQQYPPPTP